MKSLHYEKYTIEYPFINFYYKYNKKQYINYLVINEIPFELLEKADPVVLANIIDHIGISFSLHFFWLEDFDEVILDRSSLTQESIEFFQKYFINGLAELRYKNHLDIAKQIKIIPKDNNQKSSKDLTMNEKALVLNGGGKDSIIAGEIVKYMGIPFNWFLMNYRPARLNIIRKSENLKYIQISREKDLHLISSKKYPGHIPLSSFLSFLSLLPAYLFGFKYIISANEYSASDPTTRINGISVNHQYTKSFEFEKAFDNYVHKNIIKNVFYFSILRPLYELQIVKLLSKYPKYFTSFISCNIKYKDGLWCNDCPKCAFVFLILYPYLSGNEILDIFGENLFFKKSIRKYIVDLTDMSDIKPFECVGTKNECRLALFLSLKKLENVEFKEYPKKTDFFSILKNFDIERYMKEIVMEYKRPNNIPEELQKKLYTYLEANL